MIMSYYHHHHMENVCKWKLECRYAEHDVTSIPGCRDTAQGKIYLRID